MRVGLFSDCYVPDINGVVSSIVTLKSELEKLGHEVYVVATMPNKPVEEDSTHIMRLSGVELKNFYGYVITQPIHLIALNQIKEWNLDVIHVQTEFGVGMFARIVAKTLGIPLVSTYHTQYEDYTHYINFLDLKAIDTVSKKSNSSIFKTFSGYFCGSNCTEFKNKRVIVEIWLKRKNSCYSNRVRPRSL